MRLIWRWRNSSFAVIQIPRLRLPQCPSRGRAPSVMHNRRKKRAAHTVAAADQSRRTKRPGPDQQIAVPGPMRTWTDGCGLSPGGVVWLRPAGGCRRNCRAAPGGRTAGGAPPAGGRVYQHEGVSAPGIKPRVNQIEGRPNGEDAGPSQHVPATSPDSLRATELSIRCGRMVRCTDPRPVRYSGC